MTTLPRTFRHGIHPEEHKEQTAHLATERMPFVDRYVLPLSQHTGAPCRPVVRVGDRVVRGQVVAEPGSFVSTTLHSPVTGRVTALAPRHHPNGRLVDAIEIAADPFATQRVAERTPLDWRALSDDAFVQEVLRAGLVGMGGAAFPTHVKYKLPAGKRVRRLVANGCECEPFLTADHRVMVERPAEVLRGIEILGARLGVEEAVVGVEVNKPDAIGALGRELAAHPPAIPVRVVPLAVKYPQGAEKMLIKAIYGIEVPAGGLPLDVEALVNNVGTMAALADWFDRGVPLIERLVTVAGPGVSRPANLLVPVGTPVRAVLDHCGGLSDATREVVMGVLGVIYHLGSDVDIGSEGDQNRLRQQLRAARWDDTGEPVYNLPVALSLMVFFALCAQCAATLVVICRETNSWRWPAFTFTYMTALAYLGALATYQIGMRLPPL